MLLSDKYNRKLSAMQEAFKGVYHGLNNITGADKPEGKNNGSKDARIRFSS